MTLRRFILAALAAAAFGYAGAAQRPARGDEPMQTLQWVTRAGEYLRLGRALLDTAANYALQARDAVATASTVLALARHLDRVEAMPVRAELPRTACVPVVPGLPNAGSVPVTIVTRCSVDRRVVLWEGAGLPAVTVGRAPMPSPALWRVASRRPLRVTM